MEVIIKAKSSSGDPYNVYFVVKSGQFTANCECRAGMFGQLCKHRRGLVRNDVAMLFDSNDSCKFDELNKLLETVGIKDSLEGLEKPLAEIEIEIAELNKKAKKYKDQINDIFNGIH